MKGGRKDLPKYQNTLRLGRVKTKGPSGHRGDSPAPHALAQALCQHVELCNCNEHAVMQLGSWNKNKYDFLEG